MQRKVIFVLCMFFLFSGCVSKQVRIENKDIKDTISELKDIPVDKKHQPVIDKTVEKLKYAIQINIENDKLKSSIQSDKKYVKAGKFVYCTAGILVLLFCGFIVVNIFLRRI